MGKDVVCIDGKVVGAEEASVSVFDHCLLYGDGVFEGIRLINKSILLHEEHTERLYRSAEVLRLAMPDKKSYNKMLKETVEASGYHDAYIRVVITRGKGSLGVSPLKCAAPSIIIIVAQISLYPEQMYQTGLSVITARTQKISVKSLDCRVKACQYLNNIMASWEYIDRGAQDAIMLDERGFVSECTVANIFGISGNTIFTPSLDTNCLEGCTRNKALDLAREKGFEVKEGLFVVRDFMFADEVFLTGTGAGLIAVTKIDQAKIGNGAMGPKTKMLRDTYESRIQEFCTPLQKLT